MKKSILFLGLILVSFSSFSQEKAEITLSDIWSYYRFLPQTVFGLQWTQNGQYYTKNQDPYIIKFETLSGLPVDTLYGNASIPEPYPAFDEYTLNKQEDRILLALNQEMSRQGSKKAEYFVYDIQSQKKQRLSLGAKQSYACFSPDGQKVAFVQAHNLFWKDLETGEIRAITQDGKAKELIHGESEAIYEQEFQLGKAFFWSPDSKKIAYYSFDQRQVKEYSLQYWLGSQATYPENYRFKYPVAGEEISKVSISVYDILSKTHQKIDLGEETDQYIPRVLWTKGPNIVSILRLNRLQNRLDILHADLASAKTRLILREEDEAYIDINFVKDIYYLSDQKHFIISSERSGFKHLYLYTLEGKLLRALSSGNWEVRDFYGVDEKNKLLYYSSTEVSPLDRQIYRVGLNAKKKLALSTEKGFHAANFSPDFKYYLDEYHSSTLPTQTRLVEAKTGRVQKTLEDNAALQRSLEQYAISPKEFFTLKSKEGPNLRAWRIKPLNFDENKKYPVLMFVYGGPGSQSVQNSWDSFNYFWYQMLAQKGYMIVSVDNRGTGARGAKFKKMNYPNLGKFELEDQVAAAQYLASLAYVDSSRIGIWGWSYGGYLASLCLSRGEGLFKTAIAVAPVSDWRLYDCIYTERYLKRPQDNPEGYEESSLLREAARFQGNYLLIHGTGDQNVHVQHALELQNALIKQGKQFESFFYPNRDHDISGGNTRQHLYQLMTNFLLRKL